MGMLVVRETGSGLLKSEIWILILPTSTVQVHHFTASQLAHIHASYHALTILSFILIYRL